MSSLAATNSATCNKHCTFQDDSYLPICLTSLPFIGHAIQWFKEVSLNSQIQQAYLKSDNDEIAQLTETRNKYKYAGVAREILLAAATITAIALGVLNPIFGALFATAFLIFAAIHAYRAIHNVVHIIDPHNRGDEFTSRFVR